MPLFGIAHLPIHALPDLAKEVENLIQSKTLAASFFKKFYDSQTGKEYISLSCLTEEQRDALLKYALNESEFLSSYGLRSLSRFHREKTNIHPLFTTTY